MPTSKDSGYPDSKNHTDLNNNILPLHKNELPGLNKSPPHMQTKMLERKLSTPELPPIGIKPNRSPSYSPSHRPLNSSDSAITRDVDHSGVIEKSYLGRVRQSPLSPTSTSSEASARSRVSPNGFTPNGFTPNGFTRSRTWTDLNSSQLLQESAKLETLYEGRTVSRLQNLRIDENQTPRLPTKPKTQLPARFDRHINIKSTEIISPLRRNSEPEQPDKMQIISHDFPKLTVNRLSEENLKRLRHSSSKSDSQTPSSVKPDEEPDTDDEKEQRIVQWLIGLKDDTQVETAPDIAPLETTEKRDTAIHIVYQGD